MTTVLPPRTSGFRVVTKSYPSGNGCYAGQDLDDDYIEACTTKQVVGEYNTREEANKAAWLEMSSTCQFDDWGEEEFEGQEPPYCSADGPFECTDNEDEFVTIYVVDIGAEVAAKKRELEAAKTSKAPPKKKSKTAGGAVVRKFGPTKQAIKPDRDLFARNPCRIAGGTIHPPSAYPNSSKGTGSFSYLIQRISDRNYAMRAFCLDGTGATYNSLKKKNYIERIVVWMPPTNLDDHGDDNFILDAVHLDMVNPRDGKCQLTPENLQASAGPHVRCLFLNAYQNCPRTNNKADPAVLVKAIRACAPNLQCIALSECILSGDMLDAIASCQNLRGITIDTCQTMDCATDEKLANILKSCSRLKWIFVTSRLFSDASWKVLARTETLPDLEVLWISSTHSDEKRLGIANGDHDDIRKALESRASTLKLCMINYDKNLKSRYVIGSKKMGAGGDRLKGDKRPPMPRLDYSYCW